MTAAQRALLEEAVAILRDARKLLDDEGWVRGAPTSPYSPDEEEAFNRLVEEAGEGA